MATVGYVRVSTQQQSLDQQFDALGKAGVERFYQDQESGAAPDRAGLKAMMDYVREGDTVVVCALDRLGRTLTGVVKTIDELQSRGVILRSLRESVDFGTPTGRMIGAVFGALAQYERELMLERVAAAREAARIRGRLTGRPPALTREGVLAARQMREGGMSVPSIAGQLGVSKATVYRALQP
jgi:DNA invertase Pin-like site-specific DNA recombinase